MAVTIYLMPLTGAGTIDDPARAAYWDAASPSKRVVMRVGREPFCIMAVEDIAPAVDSTIVADSTCTKIPALTNTVRAGALATVQSKIEGIGIPAGWVTAGMTYQTVLQTVLRITQLYQRLMGLGAARLLGSGVTLDTTFNALPSEVRSKLLAMAQSFNFDTSSLSGASTIRQILKALADQWTTPVNLLGAF
jgi:hypothetical protein